MNKVLILGVSGFIGGTLYRELRPYFDVYGTYCRRRPRFDENQVFYSFCAEEDDIGEILNEVEPDFIVSAFRGKKEDLIRVHNQLSLYVKNRPHTKFLYFSSSVVFDGLGEYPSYEKDKPLSITTRGKTKIAIEKLLLEQVPEQLVIARLPLVLGINAPAVTQLRMAIEHKASFEVQPNLIISVTTADKIAQQIHYIISKELTGIYHLSSKDMIHHDELFIEMASKLGSNLPIFKQVYSSNNDSYLAVLPKFNKLPKTYRISVADAVAESTLQEEIITIKK